MKASLPLAVALGFASFLGALLLRLGDLGHAPWYLSRAAGLSSFVVLSGSVILGLLISRKTARLLPRVLTFELHQFLSVLAVILVGVHAGALLFDGYLGLGPFDLIIPFLAPYERVWTGIGVAAAWATVLVTASFWVKARIGHKTWRRFHYVAFAAYVMGLWHGVMAGTDAQLPVVHWMYVLSAAAVAALLTFRVGEALAMPKPASSTRPAAGRARGIPPASPVQ